MFNSIHRFALILILVFASISSFLSAIVVDPILDIQRCNLDENLSNILQAHESFSLHSSPVPNGEKFATCEVSTDYLPLWKCVLSTKFCQQTSINGSVSNVIWNCRRKNNNKIKDSRQSFECNVIYSSANSIKLTSDNESQKLSILFITPEQSFINRVQRSQKISLAPPRNLRITPHSFGKLNISWSPPDDILPIDSYELILNNLTSVPRECSFEEIESRESQDRVALTIRGDDTWVLVQNLLPDTFYRVELRAASGELRSSMERMPSSPRVPALPPKDPPRNVYMKDIIEREATVFWERPADFDCTGEVLGYFLRINSSFLVNPIEYNNITRNMTQFHLTGLMPGTQYELTLASMTRGGIGVDCKPVEFITTGERPPELDDYEDEFFAVSPEVWSQDVESRQENMEFKQYLKPAKIDLVVKDTTHSSITLEWQLKFYMRPSYSQNSQNQPELIPGVKIRIEWGLLNQGPNKETLDPSFNSFTIRNLQSNQSYYIRVIVSINNVDELAAYTIGTTKSKAFTSNFHNLGFSRRELLTYVNTVGSKTANISWKLGSAGQEITKGFLVQWYRISPSKEQENAADRFVNVTQIQNPSVRSLIIRNLKPGTIYEFSVCLVIQRNSFSDAINEDYCSLIQGFETAPLRSIGLVRQPSFILIMPAQNESQEYPGTIDSSDTPSLCQKGNSERFDVMAPRSSVDIRVEWEDIQKEFQDSSIHYKLYLTGDRFLPIEQWLVKSVHGSLNSVILTNLIPQCLYFLIIATENTYGRKVNSPVKVFRTPDSRGIGGGVIQLSRNYASARMISEPLTVEAGAQLFWPQPEPLDTRWIILATIVGTVMCLFALSAAVFFLLCKCRQSCAAGSEHKFRKSVSTGDNLGAGSTTTKSDYNSQLCGTNGSTMPLLGSSAGLLPSSHIEPCRMGCTNNTGLPCGAIYGTSLGGTSHCGSQCCHGSNSQSPLVLDSTIMSNRHNQMVICDGYNNSNQHGMISPIGSYHHGESQCTSPGECRVGWSLKQISQKVSGGGSSLPDSGAIMDDFHAHSITPGANGSCSGFADQNAQFFSPNRNSSDLIKQSPDGQTEHRGSLSGMNSPLSSELELDSCRNGSRTLVNSMIQSSYLQHVHHRPSPPSCLINSPGAFHVPVDSHMKMQQAQGHLYASVALKRQEEGHYSGAGSIGSNPSINGLYTKNSFGPNDSPSRHNLHNLYEFNANDQTSPYKNRGYQMTSSPSVGDCSSPCKISGRRLDSLGDFKNDIRCNGDGNTGPTTPPLSKSYQTSGHIYPVHSLGHPTIMYSGPGQFQRTQHQFLQIHKSPNLQTVSQVQNNHNINPNQDLQQELTVSIKKNNSLISGKPSNILSSSNIGGTQSTGSGSSDRQTTSSGMGDSPAPGDSCCSLEEDELHTHPSLMPLSKPCAVSTFLAQSKVSNSGEIKRPMVVSDTRIQPEGSAILPPHPADLKRGLSTEELHKEMANLEGLMKDLTAISLKNLD